MSLIPIGLSVGLSFARSLLAQVFVRPRFIGGMMPNVTVEEQHIDELSITDHPVEQGAAITDHSFKRPAVVIIRCGWSNSALPALGNPNYVQQIYTMMLALQASRVPIDILTGKRLYTSMLIQRLQVLTDEKTENALALVCEAREIVIVGTQTVVVPSAANMRNPQINGAVQNTGAKALMPGDSYNPNITIRPFTGG